VFGHIDALANYMPITMCTAATLSAIDTTIIITTTSSSIASASTSLRWRLQAEVSFTTVCYGVNAFYTRQCRSQDFHSGGYSLDISIDHQW